MNKFFILASSSLRRKSLLKQMGLRFKSAVPAAEEKILKSPIETVIYNATQKALSVQKQYPHSIILGVDTIVVFKNQIIGKPKNQASAKLILSQLSGRSHFVYSGLTLVQEDRVLSDYNKTKVFFDTISEDDIRAYVKMYHPCDKAGGYGIQEFAGMFIKKIHGDYYSVVGLPLNLLFKNLKKMEYSVVSL